jgi:hypothetical protein
LKKEKPVINRILYKMSKVFLLGGILASVIPSSVMWGQSFDYSNLTISNQLEYSLEKGTEDEIFEDWFELRYLTEPFSFGARFETFQPSERKNISPDSTFEGFPFRYLEFQRDDIRITAGNFYDIFGRGIAFRSYENRDVRIDTSLDGIRLGVRRDLFDFTFLSGKMLEKHISGIPQERIGLLHAANLETRLAYKYHLMFGTSLVRQNFPNSVKKEIATGRMELGFRDIFFYGEYGSRINASGSAVYLGTNFSLLDVGFSLELKRYDNFAMRTTRRQIDYNNPPALTREHTYTLLGRNGWSMDANDEKGFQVEATYSPIPMNTLLLNYSQTKNLDGDLQFEEFYGEWSRYHGDWMYMVLAYASQINLDIRSVIPILELEFFLDERNSFRAELQHQHQKATFFGEFDVDLLIAEYARSPRWTLSLIGERSNMSDFQKELQALPDKDIFLAGQANINISESHDLIVFFGSRQKGKVCVGGVCRTEPEFEGLEVKLFSRF